MDNNFLRAWIIIFSSEIKKCVGLPDMKRCLNMTITWKFYREEDGKQRSGEGFREYGGMIREDNKNH